MTAPVFFRTFLVLATLCSASAALASQGVLDPGQGGGARVEPQEASGFGPQYAQADCSAAASQAAAQTGGQVLSVQASNQGGQTVCVVTVLIPGEGGERPRRTTITIPG